MIVLLITVALAAIVMPIYLIRKQTVPDELLYDKEEEKVVEEEIVVEPLINLTAKLTETYLTLDNYIGQTNSIIYLKGHIRQAKNKDRALKHIILWGPGGLGKSTLIKGVAQEMGGRYIEIVPANLKSTKELFGVFFLKACPACGHNNPYSSGKCLKCKEDISIYFKPELLLQDKDIVFLEECHRLRQDIEEALYSLMQDGYMMVRYNGVDQRIDFPDITIAGATTLLSNLNPPFKDRFRINIQLNPYTRENIKKIGMIYAAYKKYEITEEVLEKVAAISHGVPRIAKKYIDDCSTIADNITIDTLSRLLELLGIDEYGLSKSHRKAIRFILERMKASKNGAAGASSIATSMGVSMDDYLELYEMALIYQDFVFQGARGRRLTDRCMDIYFADEKGLVK